MTYWPLTPSSDRSSRGSSSREFSGMQPDEVVHADRLLACEVEKVVGHSIVATLFVQLRHHGEVLNNVSRHTRPQQFFAPAGEWHVAIADRSTQCLGEYARVVLQIGRFKTGQILDFADVRRGVLEDDRYGARHVQSRDRRGFAPAHGQRQLVGVPHARGSEKAEKSIEEDRGPHGVAYGVRMWWILGGYGRSISSQGYRNDGNDQRPLMD